MTVSSGPITQTAWVVPDIAATETALTQLMGVRRWTRMPDIAFDAATCSYRGTPGTHVAHISLGYVADMQLELIQPISGESIYTEFLTQNPSGGLHHVCVEVDDLDEALTRTDLPVVQRGSMAGDAIRFAYLGGADRGVPYLELAQLTDVMRDFFASLKESA